MAEAVPTVPANPADPRTLIRIAEDGQMEAIDKLIANGFDLQGRDDGGNTALHLAAYQVAPTRKCAKKIDIALTHLPCREVWTLSSTYWAKALRCGGLESASCQADAIARRWSPPLQIAQVDPINDNRDSPLHLAALSNRFEVLAVVPFAPQCHIASGRPPDETVALPVSR
jgi:hypothetical protein